MCRWSQCSQFKLCLLWVKWHLNPCDCMLTILLVIEAEDIAVLNNPCPRWVKVLNAVPLLSSIEPDKLQQCFSGPEFGMMECPFTASHAWVGKPSPDRVMTTHLNTFPLLCNTWYLHSVLKKMYYFATFTVTVSNQNSTLARNDLCKMTNLELFILKCMYIWLDK